MTGKMEKGIHAEEKAVENGEWEDPERVVIGHAKRPMILTHTVMVGLTLTILIALEAVVVSKVSNNDRTNPMVLFLANQLCLGSIRGEIRR
jgi:hypothetical protein